MYSIQLQIAHNLQREGLWKDFTFDINRPYLVAGEVGNVVVSFQGPPA